MTVAGRLREVFRGSIYKRPPSRSRLLELYTEDYRLGPYDPDTLIRDHGQAGDFREMTDVAGEHCAALLDGGSRDHQIVEWQHAALAASSP